MIGSLVLAAAAVLMPPPPPQPTTIAEVHRNPAHWNGKWIRLEGWINRCWSTDCTVAENLAARPINQGKALSFETQKSFDDWVRPMLPMRVSVVARLDATCLLEVCLDRAPHLREMHVEALKTNLKYPDEDR